MHCADEALLHVSKFDGLLVTAFSLYLCRDTSDHDDCIGICHILLEFVKLDKSALADIGVEHCKVALASPVFDHNLISLTFSYIE